MLKSHSRMSRSHQLFPELCLGATMAEEVNPFAAPQTAPEPYLPEALADDEMVALRQRYLKHEASVRSIGFLYYFAAFIMAATAIMALSGIATGVAPGPVELGLVLFLFAIAIALFFGGHWLRRLDRRARFVVAIFSGLGLVQIPIGTIIHGYILWLVFSRKGSVVFSAHYQKAISCTPHIKYRSSKVLIVLLVVVLAILSLAIVAAFLG